MTLSLSAQDMKTLSFPDFEVESMGLSLTTKSHSIVVEGAWLDGKEIELGKGTLYFEDWQNLNVEKYVYELDRWVEIKDLKTETLVDICEVTFLIPRALCVGSVKWMVNGPVGLF